MTNDFCSANRRSKYVSKMRLVLMPNATSRIDHRDYYLLQYFSSSFVVISDKSSIFVATNNQSV